jgi:gliding motility-associated-like protein
VYGQTEMPGRYYRINSVFGTNNSGQFVTKFSSNLNTVVWSTSFGLPNGVPALSPTAFLVDLCSKVYLSGWGGRTNQVFYYLVNDSTVARANNATTTSGLPTTSDAFQSTTDGSDFYLMAIEDDASRLSYGSFFGGNKSDEHVDGGTSRFDRKGKIYQSVCAGCGKNQDFPIFPRPGAVSETNNSENCNNAVFKIDFNLPIVVANFSYSGCNPVFFTNKSQERRATRYQWFFGDGSQSTEKNPTHTYQQPGTYQVKLLVLDDFTCNLADTITKSVYVSPIMLGVGATANPKMLIEGNNTSLEAFPKRNDFSYQWSPANLVTSPTKSTTLAFPRDTTDFEVEVTDLKNNCSAKARVRVEVLVLDCQSSLFIPNAFTPNDDNTNEKIFVKSPYIESFNFSIFNRWGEKVFETTNPSEGWDGKYRGKSLDPDVYVYYLQGVCLDKESFFKKGNITLIK